MRGGLAWSEARGRQELEARWLTLSPNVAFDAGGAVPKAPRRPQSPPEAAWPDPSGKQNRAIISSWEQILPEEQRSRDPSLPGFLGPWSLWSLVSCFWTRGSRVCEPEARKPRLVPASLCVCLSVLSGSAGC